MPAIAMTSYQGIQSIKLAYNGDSRRTSLQDALQLVGQPQFSLEALRNLVAMLNFENFNSNQPFNFSFTKPDGQLVLLDSNDAVAQAFWATHNAQLSTLSLSVSTPTPSFLPSPTAPLYSGLISPLTPNTARIVQASMAQTPVQTAGPIVQAPCKPQLQQMWERQDSTVASPGDDAASCFIRCTNGMCHSSSNWPTVIVSSLFAVAILVALNTDWSSAPIFEDIVATIFTPYHLAELVGIITGILTLCCVGYCCVGCSIGCLSCALSGCSTWACGLFNWLSIQAVIVNLVVVIPMNIVMIIAYNALRLSGVIWFVNKNFNYVVTNAFYFGQHEVTYMEASMHTFIDACQVAFKAFFPLQDVLEVPHDEIRQRCLVIFRAVFGRVLPQIVPLWFKKTLAFRMFCAYSFQTVMGWWLIGPGHVNLLSSAKKTTTEKRVVGENSSLLEPDLECARPITGNAAVHVAYEGQGELPLAVQAEAPTSAPRRGGKIFKGRRPHKEESLNVEVTIWDCKFLREARTWAGDDINTVGGMGDDVCTKE